jgi:Carboxypeptidase regulatory-like domain
VRTNLIPLSILVLLLASRASAQQYNGPPEKPDVFIQNNRPKNEKESNTRTIEGTVKDAADNPLASAIVRLKNVKTSKIVNFATKDDGKFTFHDLPLDNNFELVATRGELAAPMKKISVYDTRKKVTVNFQLTAVKP